MIDLNSEIEESSILKATLVVRDCDKKIWLCDLTKREKWSFGRATSSIHPDICVKSGIVSRDHGVFMCVERQWFYLDHGGKNGTFINNEKILSGKGKRKYPVLLNDGDMLRVDHSDLTNPDTRGVFLLFLERKVSDLREAEGIFTKFSIHSTGCNLK
ncbi:MAG: FHA domain-containing protein [Lachnospiraceae bacterium]|nr:FHA domain-containing protein [Lachnospiraceae bacterium]